MLLVTSIFMIVIKFLTSIFLLGGLFSVAHLVFTNEPIVIQSLESKTIDNNPVYNKIAFSSVGQKDIWMMNQSHHRIKADKNKWDRLAIVVDKEKSPTEATFLQLPPGELVWNDNLMKQNINFKVSCFMCHSNGPRAIRPNYKDYNVPLLSKAKVFIWNLKIKSYGLIKENPKQLTLDEKLEVPFRHRYSADNIELNVKSCNQCHSGENKLFYRNKLTRQNNISIKFMIENKIMPPPGFSISKNDLKEIKKFIRGI